MKKTILRVAVCLLSLLVALSFPMVSSAEENTVTLDLKNGSIAITATGYSVGGAAETPWTQDYIICSTGGDTTNTVIFTSVTCNVVLDKISMKKTSDDGVSMISLTSASDVTLILNGTNSIIYAQEWYQQSAISVSGDSKLTIDSVNGTDALNVAAGQFGAAIGSPQDSGVYTSQIVINSGIISAVAGRKDHKAGESAAIGGARNSGAQVTINGGSITAIGRRNGPAIGAGRECPDGSTVTINGGIVVAEAEVNSAGIGGGFKSNAKIVINGGIVTATTATANLYGLGIGMDYVGSPDIEINGGSVLSKQATNVKPLVGVTDKSDNALTATTVTLPAASGFLYVDGAKQLLEGTHAADSNTYYLYLSAGDHVLKTATCGVTVTAGGTVAANEWTAFQTDFVGYQTTAANEGKFSLRLVAVLKNDNLAAYESVGMIVAASYDNAGTPVERNKTETFTTVYTSLTAADGTNYTEYTASDFGGDYFFALNCINLPANSGAITFRVTTFYIAGGNTVEEEIIQFTVNPATDIPQQEVH